MGALSTPPEAGDAPMNIPRKSNPSSTNIDLSNSKNFGPTPSKYKMHVRPSSSKGNNRIFDRVMLIEDDIFSDKYDDSLRLDHSSVPCHSLHNRGSTDAVLVKDVGVSCTLIRDDNNYENTSTSIIQNYLINQLRSEYNDLFDITKKLSSYTRDILTDLSRKNKKKALKDRKSLSSEHTRVSNYVDEKGDLCLKLRLLADVETQYSKCAFCDERTDTFYADCLAKKRKSLRDRRMISRNAATQSQLPKAENALLLSPMKRSRSSIFNALSITKSKSEDFSSFTFCSAKTGNSFQSSSETIDNHESTPRCLKRCNPVIFTNWKEISRRNAVRSEMINNEKEIATHALRTADYPNKTTFTIGESITTGMNFHKINIRIIKRKRDCINI